MSLGPTQSLKLMEKLNQKRKCSVCMLFHPFSGADNLRHTLKMKFIERKS